MSSSKSISREIRKILYGSAVAGLAMTGTARAQESGQVIEEVVVEGIRASLEQSLEIKRNAAGVVDALTAEDVGKFPDKNLAEALQRVPGIVVNREFGEGERVSVRGTNHNLTKTLLNGHTVATADWFVLEQLSTTRSFNYLMMPSEVIGQVIVHKSSQADLEEGGIGATIDVRTRNPLDLPSQTLNLSLQGAYSKLSDEKDPQISGLWSWKNDEETVGFLAAAVYQERNIRRDGVEVLGYFPVDIDPDAEAVNNVLAPDLIGSALFRQERIRSGGNVGFQFAPSDALSINVTGLYSRFEADNINENFLAWGSRAVNGGGTLSDITIIDDTAVAGRIASVSNGADGEGTGGRAAVYDAIDRFATATTSSIDVDTTYRPNEAWDLHFKLGYTEAEGNTDDQILAEFGAPGVFEYDLRGRAPQVRFLPNALGNAVDPADPSTMLFDFGNLNEITNDDDELYVYLDAERQVEMGSLKAVKFGAKYSDHERVLVFNATTYGSFFAPMNASGCDGGPCSAPFFAGPLTPGDFLDGISSDGTLSRYWEVNRGLVEETFFNAFTGRIPYPPQNFSVKEKAYAGYVMGTLEGENWRGNAGVRVVRTEQDSTGNQIGVPDPEESSPFGDFTPVSASRSYTEVLPSLNLAYDVTDEVVLRFAAARVMTRPDFVDIAPRVTLNPGALTGTGGDPETDPYLANQADLAIEWYPDRGSALALAVYYKDLESFITDDVVTRILPVTTANPITACTPIDVSQQLFNCPFTINQRVNNSGRVSGFEVALTRPLWGGFGVQTNYTFADAEADNGDPVPGASKDTFNLTGYFENERLSARLAYTYRSEFFVTFDRSTHLNQEALESLDLSVAVKVLDNVTLTFDGVNLTNDKIVQFADDPFRPRAIYNNGSIYFVGARVSF